MPGSYKCQAWVGAGGKKMKGRRADTTCAVCVAERRCEGDLGRRTDWGTPCKEWGFPRKPAQPWSRRRSMSICKMVTGKERLQAKGTVSIKGE